MKRLGFFTLCLSLFSSLSQAQLSPEIELLYLAAVAGDRSASGQAFAQLKDTHDQAPQDVLTLAYLGSASTLMGRDSPLDAERLTYTRQGLAYLDQALAAMGPLEHQRQHHGLSEATYIQALAAVTQTELPAFFGRAPQGLRLFQQLMAQPEFQQAPLTARAWIYPYAVKAALAGGQPVLASDWAKALTEALPQSAEAQQIRTLLAP